MDMRRDIFEKKEEILQMISNNESKSKICKMLKCKPETLERYLKSINVDYRGNKGLKGKKTDSRRKSAIEYSKKEYAVKSPMLRRKLIEDGLKENKCEMCGINEWLGQKLKLELHHINGDRFDNNLNNLQILCPNCHSLTPNHGRTKTFVVK